MAGAANTSVTVQFDDQSTSNGLVVMERSNRQPEKNNMVFFRIHGMNGHAIISTSGSVARTQSGLSRYTTQFVTFDGTSSTQLTYPEAAKLTIGVVGGMFNLDGTRLSVPAVEFNAATNSITVKNSAGVYGVVFVTYDAPYELWLASFSGACPTVEPNAPPLDLSRGGADDDVLIPGRDPMLIMAWKNGVAEATLSLEPPECEYPSSSGSGGGKSMEAKLARLVIEEDPDDPLELQGSEASALRAGGTLRVYPGDAEITFITTAGTVSADKSQIYTYRVTETIQFSGRSSAQLKYPPKTNSLVAASPIGNMSDEWGRLADIEIRTPGQSVTAVDWVSKNSYKNPQRRYLNGDEIAIVNMFGVALPVYGAVEVTYVTDYWKADYKFEYDSDNRVFVDAWAVATRNNEVDSIALRAPTTKGKR